MLIYTSLFVQAGAMSYNVIILYMCFSQNASLGMAILGAASLGFLGLGAQPPMPEWGSMISIARNYLPTWWWYSIFPGLAIYLTVLGLSLIHI